MKNNVKPLGAVQFVNSHHKTVLILVVYFGSAYTWFGKETRIIPNHIPTSSSVQLVQIFSPNGVYDGGGLAKELMLIG